MMMLNNRRSSSLLLQLISLALSTSISLSRLNNNSILQRQQQPESQKHENSGAFPPVTASSTFPSARETLELAHLSSIVYYILSLHAHDCSPFDDLLRWYAPKHTSFVTDGATYRCHLYERDAQDTQVLVLSRTADDGGTTAADGHDDARHGVLGDYVAVVYAGTDNFRTALTDLHTSTERFGPGAANGTYPLSPSDAVRVHAGFNNAVFGYGLMDRVSAAVRKVVGETRADGAVGKGGEVQGGERKIFTTGHSLGAANSVLCGVALSRYFDRVSNVSFGCPKTGNYAWMQYANSIPNLGVWRIVNLLDIVPRMPFVPGIAFRPVGHTLQLGRKDARAYWFHEGDVDLGYRGVPHGWSASSYVLTPVAVYEHFINRYIDYLHLKSLADEDRYFANEFERISNATDKSYAIDAPEIDDSEMRNIGKKYAEQYLKFAREEHEIVDKHNIGTAQYERWITNKNVTLEIL